MNIPRLLLAIVVAFVIIFGTDMLIHGMWLKPDYDATKLIWRPESEMNARIGWMFVAQITCAATFVLIWAWGFSGGSIGTAVMFAVVMGMFQGIWVLVNYTIIPMPGELAVKWYFSGLAQAVLIGIATSLIYRPRAATT
jgi:hypothetical protein